MAIKFARTHDRNDDSPRFTTRPLRGLTIVLLLADLRSGVGDGGLAHPFPTSRPRYSKRGCPTLAFLARVGTSTVTDKHGPYSRPCKRRKGGSLFRNSLP